MRSTDTRQGSDISLGRGDGEQYLHSDRDLYHVEQIGPERALLEDCRTGTLLDVPLSHLRDLEPVTLADAADPGPR
jgi:hypothetical protein